MADVTFDFTNLIEVEGGLGEGEISEIKVRLDDAKPP